MQKNIYKRFDLPVALRGVDTPGKLGSSQEIKDAYDYYNSVTNKERRAFERMYTDLFLNFVDIKSINPTMDFSIIPMKYISSSDKEMTEQVSTDKSKEDEPVD
jgi:hypothetical protein